MCRPLRQVLPLSLLLSVAAAGCQCERTPEEEVAETMTQALNCLIQGDGPGYACLIEGYNPADSLHNGLYALAVSQLHQEDLNRRGGQTNAHVTRVEMHPDTTATAYYVCHYANGDSIECAQRLVLQPDGWRLARTASLRQQHNTP